MESAEKVFQMATQSSTLKTTTLNKLTPTKSKSTTLPKPKPLKVPSPTASKSSNSKMAKSKNTFQMAQKK